MKKIFLGVCLLFLAFALQAQHLHKIVAEKYYVASAADAADASNVNGDLKAGSVTWRLYVEMEPDWYIVNVYGNTYHPMTISTPATKFFNVHGTDNTSPNAFTSAQLKTGLNALDSYVAMGSPAKPASNLASVLKLDDSDGSIFSTGTALLNNVDPTAGLSVKTNDGNVSKTPGVVPSFSSGFEAQLSAIFGDGDATTLNNITVTNGNWSNTVFLKGPQNGTGADKNRVLIAQLTSDQLINYSINLTIGHIDDPVNDLRSLERYVNSPVVAGDLVGIPSNYTFYEGAQYKLSGTLGAPVTLPIVTLAVTNGSTFTEPAPVAMEASISNSPSAAIDSVVFFADGVRIGKDADGISPYTLSWPSVAKTGTIALTSRAYTSEGSGVSSGVNITVNGNAAPSVTALTATPANIYRGTTATLGATVTDTDGGVASVTISVDGGAPVAATKNMDVYSISYPVPMSATKGTHSFRVVATDGYTTPKTTTVDGSFTVGNQAPSAAITSPAVAGFNLVSGNDTMLVATVNDLDADNLTVSFYEAGNPTALVTLTSAPYQYNYVASGTGSKVITAVATDGITSTTSANYNFSVVAPSGKDYELGNLSVLCSEPDNFCLPIKAAKAISGVTGYDITMIFDHTKVNPTGIISVYEGANGFVTDRDFVSYDRHLYPGTDSVKFTIYLNSTAPANTYFAGDAGDVLACVEFSRLPSFGSHSTTTFSTRVLQESSLTGYKMNGATDGSYSTRREKDFAGSLSFWSDNSPIAYTSGVNLITDIFGDKIATPVNPDASGNFIYDITNGTNMTIKRDVPNAAPMSIVGAAISGLDAYYTAKVTTDDASYKPNVYQLIAMDVNRDGRVTAGDITQMQQRSVLKLDQYTQANGTNLDWVFVPSKVLVDDVNYRISTKYPYATGDAAIGVYYKNAVPVVPVVKNLVTLGNVDYTIFGNDTCTSIRSENFKGILLGDVTGNYGTMGNSTQFKSGKVNDAKYVFEISDRGSNEYEIKISTENVDVVNGYNVVLECSKFAEIVGYTDLAKMNMASNLKGNQLGVTGFGKFSNGALASIVLKAKSNVDAADINVTLSAINEKNVGHEMSLMGPTGIEDLNESAISIYPNPVSDVLSVAVVEKSTIQLMDVNGKVIMEVAAEAGEVKELDVTGLSDGMYVVKVVSEKTKAVSRKVLVQK